MSAAAAGAVIAGEFGASAPPLVLQAKDVLLRRFDTPKQYVDDVSLSRIYLGVHYRLSVDVGIAMGTAIGKLGAQRHFLPLAKRNAVDRLGKMDDRFRSGRRPS